MREQYCRDWHNVLIRPSMGQKTRYYYNTVKPYWKHWSLQLLWTTSSSNNCLNTTNLSTCIR